MNEKSEKNIDISGDGKKYKNNTVIYHRKPTPLEVKLGYGAIHYIDVDADIVRKKDGSFKRWFIHDDGLRYYW